MRTLEKRYYLPFTLVSVLFLLWGLANNMTDTLLAAFRRVMQMSDTETSLIQFAFYGSYFCFALPAALFIRRYSYKSGILLGLLLYAGGAILFYPAALAESYAFYLVAIYILAGKPGSLYRILGKFEEKGYNLVKLESRPIPDTEFEFMFYFDFEASIYHSEFSNTISELKNLCDSMEYLGSYTEKI